MQKFSANRKIRKLDGFPENKNIIFMICTKYSVKKYNLSHLKIFRKSGKNPETGYISGKNILFEKQTKHSVKKFV